MAFTTRTIFGMPPKTLGRKMTRETALFFGYHWKVDPLDAAFWARNYNLYGNISNPFNSYEFNVGGQVRSFSLDELCLFEQGNYTSAVTELRQIISEVCGGDNALFGESSVGVNPSPDVPLNFRNGDARFNHPNEWFNFPHTTDVYTPSATLHSGVPVPKTTGIRLKSPNPIVFDRTRFSDDAYHRLVERIADCMTRICIASNIHPGLCAMLFVVMSPYNNSQDYRQMDAISAEIIRNNRSRLGSGGVIDLDNPRAFWAHTFDGDERDIANTAQVLSDLTGITLESRANSYYCRFAFPVILPNVSSQPTSRIAARNIADSSIDSWCFSRSLQIRAPWVVNSQGVRIYADCISALTQLVNAAIVAVNHPPQVWMHAGMSLHNALLMMSFNQIGGSLNTIRDYTAAWNREVLARNSVAPGQLGYRVALQQEITPENIGTLFIAAGNTVMQAGNQYGAILTAAGALVREMPRNEYGELLVRAAPLEFIRQDGSHSLDSTIYRGFTPRSVLSCQPVPRIPQTLLQGSFDR